MTLDVKIHFCFKFLFLLAKNQRTAKPHAVSSHNEHKFKRVLLNTVHAMCKLNIRAKLSDPSFRSVRGKAKFDCLSQFTFGISSLVNSLIP